jgi:type VI secretion system protein ImpL
MQKILDFLFSRRMLAIIGVILLALAIWFVGPLLAFGGLHPFASVSMRVITILLLFALLFLWFKNWPLSVIWVAALCVLIWKAAPLLAYGQARPFAPAWVRAALIGIVLFCYAFYGLYRLWQALRVDEQLLQKILRPRKDKSAASEVREDQRAVTNIVIRAIEQLKQLRIGKPGIGLSRLFEGKRYLYELPWYMIIGAPGDGKTTALLNAGLQFPLAEQMGHSAEAVAVPGKGGTLHCDWWFTNEAVLIDTAGRYVRHDDSGSTETTARNAEEWRGFLGLLRKYRPRAPINGVLLTVNVADLAGKSEAERIAAAAALRARLGELRSELGIRFPVYLVVTKMDLLPGFTDYFNYLTTEGRAQIWGFTLPYNQKQQNNNQDKLRLNCENELKLLIKRLDQGVDNRLQEEYDIQRRSNLYALPHEFSALAEPLLDIIERVFLDSKFDATQLHNTLRGVYFTSAAQASANATADRQSPLKRLWRAIKGDPALGEKDSLYANTVAPTGNRSYFLHDLLTKLVFQEQNLVQPNLQWEMRYRVMRFTGHMLVVFIFLCLVQGMYTSYGKNSNYLSDVNGKTATLAEKVREYSRKPTPEAVPDILNAARELAAYPGLDPDSPPNSFRYGLYSVPPVINSAAATYDQLLDQLLLPPIVRGIERTLSNAIVQKDTKATYDALRVYLLLNLDTEHQDKFNASEIQAWVLSDWEQNDGAAVFGGNASIYEHLGALFNGSRIVRSPFAKNDALIRNAREMLEGSTSTERIYDRAKVAMNDEAPEDFTVVRAVGADAGSVFVRASGSPLDRGIPGLFTVQGYRDLFDKRISEFVAAAYADDEWVMGRETVASQKKTAERAQQLVQQVKGAEDPLIKEVRRLYLTEYTMRWQTFLEDIHSVNSTGADNSPSLAFDLQTLRTFAAPDSPLMRLSRAVVEQTTLVPPLNTKNNQKILAERAEQQLSGNAREVVQTAKLLKNIRPEEQLEKTLVDNRFAALREVVTGVADIQNSNAGSRPQKLDSVLSLLNEYYNQLMIADNALATNTLPPKIDAAEKLRLEAAKMPAPLKNILFDLTTQGARKLNLASGEVLSRQMEAMIGGDCRNVIDGRYPFVASNQEVSADEFNRIFASGGLLDDFFNKQLISQVDITTNPWHYKQAEGSNTPLPGPSLAPFQQAKRIREAFFQEQGARKMSWTMDIKVVELDPNITDLIIDIDGQSLRYIHGPVRPLHITWPGPRNGSMAEITANPRIRQDSSTIITSGPWALFRLLNKGRIISSMSDSRHLVEFKFDDRRVVLEVSSSVDFNLQSANNPLRGFTCPVGGATL